MEKEQMGSWEYRNVVHGKSSVKERGGFKST